MRARARSLIGVTRAGAGPAGGPGRRPASPSRGATCASCCARSRPARRTPACSSPPRPPVLMATSLLVAATAPFVATRPVSGGPRDLFVVVALLLLGTVALALAGLDTGTAFGGMGSSRDMTIAALVEPTAAARRVRAVHPGRLHRPVGDRRRRRRRPAPAWSPRPACSPPRRSAIAVAGRDRPDPGRQPVHPPGADDGPRGHGAGVLRPRPGPGRVGRGDAADHPARPAGEPVRPVGHRHQRPAAAGWPSAPARFVVKVVGARPRCWPPARCSWRSCGCSGCPSCSPGRSCSPSSPSSPPTSWPDREARHDRPSCPANCSNLRLRAVPARRRRRCCGGARSPR